MKKNNNSGITLIALIITIIIIFIIAAITVYEGSKLVDEAKYEDVKTNMLLIQAEIKNYVEQAKFENKTIQDITTNGIAVEGKATLTIAEPSNPNLVVVDNEHLYKITTTMSDLKLSNIDAEKYLIVIYTDSENKKLTGDVDVYFVPGFDSINGEDIHFLSEME
ncbi:MAG: hypothetical protein IKF17_01130 [Clostridia bacterium]|nr:hypothetical protein [Clostridia bacterium]